MKSLQCWSPVSSLGLFGLLALELSFFTHCAIETNERTAQRRFIAVDTPCNEYYGIYSAHLDCPEIKKSLDPRMAWVDTAQCLVQKHNIFSLWGWLELGIAGASLLALLYLFYLYKVKTAKYERKRDRHLLAAPGPARWRGARVVYDNGVEIEQIE